MASVPLIDNEEVMAKVRAAADAITSPNLDELRRVLPQMRTSRLMILISHPRELFAAVDSKLYTDDAYRQEVCLAAAIAVSDELDRRIPPREGTAARLWTPDGGPDARG